MIVNQDSGDSGLLLAVSSLPKRSRMHRKTKVESCSFIPLLKILWTLYLSNLSFFKPLPLHHSHQGRNFAHSNIRKEFKILSFTKTISGASTAETFQKPLEPLKLCNSHLFQTFSQSFTVLEFSFRTRGDGARAGAGPTPPLQTLQCGSALSGYRVRFFAILEIVEVDTGLTVTLKNIKILESKGSQKICSERKLAEIKLKHTLRGHCWMLMKCYTKTNAFELHRKKDIAMAKLKGKLSCNGQLQVCPILDFYCV